MTKNEYAPVEGQPANHYSNLKMVNKGCACLSGSCKWPGFYNMRGLRLFFKKAAHAIA